MSASLENTMTPYGVMTPEEAQQQQILAEQAARTAEATNQMNAASQQYQQAAQPPVPQVDPFSALLQTLGGNISSVLSQNPSYRQNAQQRLRDEQNDLMQARAQNLAAMQQTFQARAEEARQAGNLEAQQKFQAQLQ